MKTWYFRLTKARIRLILFLVSLFWLTGITLPVFSGFCPESVLFIPFLKLTYSHVCHQMPAKTPAFWGHFMLVCSRCLGIYAGFFVFSLVSFFHSFRPNTGSKKFVLFSAPMLSDVVFSSLGIYSYNKISAFITGAVFGSVVFVYISNIIFDIFCKKQDII